MGQAALRLRVDSPYTGESMSSFVSRASQFYAMPVPALLKQLLAGQSGSSRPCRDIDLEPPPMLEQRLSEAVANWRSPLAEHQGFRNWTLVQRQRCAYCPICFQEDLAAGRTPYFRNDWIPVFVTTCWVHGTPLFDWEMVYAGGWRRWPKGWLYEVDAAAEKTPPFMRHHLDLLEQLRGPAADQARVCDGIGIPQALACLKWLQGLMEKPSAGPKPDRKAFRTELDDFVFVARELVRTATRYEVGHPEPPIGMVACPAEASEWFGPLPRGARRRRKEFMDYGIRLHGCIHWRRCYLMFVARSLMGAERFPSIFPPEPAGVFGSWWAWWREIVLPGLGPRQQESLGWYMRMMRCNL